MLRRLASIAALAVLAGGCLPGGNRPLETLTYDSEPPRNRGLIVFLQGMGGTTSCFTAGNKCFAAEGFVAAVRSRGLPYDMASPAAHFGYYRDRTLEERLRSDVSLPAKARGYERIWLVGVVRSWQPEGDPARGDWQRGLWQWLKQRNRAPDAAPLFLGYGTGDPYAKAHRLLADDLVEALGAVRARQHLQLLLVHGQEGAGPTAARRSLRHIPVTAERCCLPALTRFTG